MKLLAPTLQRYPEVMESNAENPDEVVAEFLGIPVTRAGRERARRKLDDAAARMTPEQWAELQAQFGFRPRAIHR